MPQTDYLTDSRRHPMRLIATKCHPADRRDRLRYCRADGSSEEIDLPRQGILPHDLVHALVEDGLALNGGFMDRVAQGQSPEFQMSKNMPMTKELGIAESVVEAMQTQLAQGRFDPDAFLYGVITACDSRGIADMPIPDDVGARAVFEKAILLNERWRELRPTQTMEIVFHDPDGC
jgi:hypothetical protein